MKTKATSHSHTVPGYVSAADYGGDIGVAIAHLPSTGGAVFLPDGVYTVDETIVIERPDVRLFGESWATVIRAEDSWTEIGAPMFVLDGPRATISRLVLDGNRRERGPVSAANMVRPQAEDIRLDNVHVTDAAWDAIVTPVGQVAPRLRVTDGLFDGGYGTYLAIYSAWRVMVDGNTMLPSASDSPIVLDEPDECVVSHNLLPGSIDCGVNLRNAGVRCQVIGNRITDPASYGIAMTGVTDSVVLGNVVRGAHDFGIMPGERNTITANVVLDTHGTPIFQKPGCSILGNIVA